MQIDMYGKRYTDKLVMSTSERTVDHEGNLPSTSQYTSSPDLSTHDDGKIAQAGGCMIPKGRKSDRALRTEKIRQQ